MTGKARFLIGFLIAAVTIILVSCKPIAYYLQQVYKAYGTVTEAGTGGPLESVEVFLGSYQYSVLTNGLGDYGIELAEGTWTLHFVKNGYTTLDKVVTVNAANPRVKVDAQLTPLAPPASTPEFVGTWQASMGEGRGAITLTLTETLGTITAADAPSPSLDLETDRVTITSYDTTLKHIKIEINSVRLDGTQQAKWVVGDVIFVLYSLSGNTLTVNFSTDEYPTDLFSGIALTRQ